MFIVRVRLGSPHSFRRAMLDDDSSHSLRLGLRKLMQREWVKSWTSTDLSAQAIVSYRHWLCTKSLVACEAGLSIKPGA